jgi:DNA repair photolyase
MRWDNLSMEIEERARLPGYRAEAVVRHFDAPGAVRTRFYEVRAKSILNRVPEASQVPFRWTVNPYRGCSHACVYCLSAETAILTADGRTKPIADLRPGELIYGTVRDQGGRRLTVTAVLDKWSSIKPAWEVELEDGTKLRASADHRFLSERGWKYVTAGPGARDRPHLDAGAALVGPGGGVDPPEHDFDYRRGYLAGLTRADGIADHEALDRARRFADVSSVETPRYAVTRAGGAAIRRHIGSRLHPIEWPTLPTLSWIKGFLAGVFDAAGSCDTGRWRLSGLDSEGTDRIRLCLSRLGFGYEIGPQATVYLHGGLREQMRFGLTTDPAITRKRSLEGSALDRAAPVAIVSIRPLGTAMRMYDITTGTGDFIANGVVSHNCFARPTHKYLDFDAGRDFEREIVVKVNAPERLRVELARPSWKGEHVALGTNTDPYQWVEGRYKLMPGIWEAFRDAANPCSVLTKSPLLLRDLPLMREIAARTEFSAALSVPTLDERAWRATEPHTPNPRARLEAVGELTRAGIKTGVLVAPLMPGINDDPAQVAKILELASEAGAAYVTGIALHLRGEVRGLFLDWLREHRPDLVARYDQLYARGAYAPGTERRRLAQLVKGPDLPPGERMRGRTEKPPARAAARPALKQGRLF